MSANDHPGLSAAIDAIDAVLPQTQCTRCGYPACRPYAQAIAEGSADINRCPPGGAANIVVLARLTGRPVKPLDPDCGVEGPRQIVWIDPARCIGCTLCIQACPVDAIIGAPKWLHAVIEERCTGCDLCRPPCPVDCIEWAAAPEGPGWSAGQAAAARDHYLARQARLGKAEPPAPAAEPPIDPKRALLDRIQARARQRLARQTPEP